MINSIAEDEYEIYTQVCKTDLFLFSLSGTTFNDYTGVYRNYTEIGKNRWATPFTGKCKYLCVCQPEILLDFTRKNEQSYKLEKKFYVENGYQFLSEKLLVELLNRRGIFSLSRVGFTDDRVLGLVYIGYSCVGYYLLFRYQNLAWQLVGYNLAWVS